MSAASASIPLSLPYDNLYIPCFPVEMHYPFSPCYQLLRPQQICLFLTRVFGLTEILVERPTPAPLQLIFLALLPWYYSSAQFWPPRRKPKQSSNTDFEYVCCPLSKQKKKTNQNSISDLMSGSPLQIAHSHFVRVFLDPSWDKISIGRAFALQLPSIAQPVRPQPPFNMMKHGRS